MLKLPEIFKNSKAVFDPDMCLGVHEAGHGAVMTIAYGLLPRYTTLKGFKGTVGFSTATFSWGWDLGIDWAKQGPEYLLSHSFGGIVAQGLYSGSYDWVLATSDMESVERTVAYYNLDFKEVVRIWSNVHELIHENFDLVMVAAEKLYQDKVINDQFWEELLLTEKRANIGK